MLAAIMLTACDMLDYHPYDVNVKPTSINVSNGRRIEQLCAAADTVRFIAAGDTQGRYDDTADFVDFVNGISDSAKIDFVLHTGDFTDYGTVDEYDWQRRILNRLKVPYVGCLGNHDCLGTGKQAYARIFGPSDTSFIAGGVKFVLLNTNALEYDYSVPVPDLDFIERQGTERTGEFSRTVVAMHAHPYSDVFNNNVAKAFEHYITQLPGLMMCINGHDHNLVQRTYFDDGVMYYGTPNIAKRQFYIFTITPNGYDYEVVSF